MAILDYGKSPKISKKPSSIKVSKPFSLVFMYFYNLFSYLMSAVSLVSIGFTLKICS